MSVQMFRVGNKRLASVQPKPPKIEFEFKDKQILVSDREHVITQNYSFSIRFHQSMVS